MYFLYIYEYGTLKPVEVISRSGVGEEVDEWKDKLNLGTT
jgi:hypothetical protein